MKTLVAKGIREKYPQSIGGIMLEESHIDKWVTYVPTHAKNNLNHPDCERGRIITWNSMGIFVDYIHNKCLTNSRDLIWG